MASETISDRVLGQPRIEALERETIKRLARRLLPLLMICYFVAFLDRVNVGFAALTMNKAVGLSATVFGFGSGIFFFGYFLFEVPSNIILSRVGARTWIARIMLTWGIISGLTAAVTGPYSFYAIRFLLGLAEAGFYPGIVLYLTWWFPSYYRSRILGMFMTAIPISNLLGSLVSGPLLALDGWLGLQGWQWLFIAEAIPAIVLGVVVLLYLTDRPSDAHWLEPAQRQWLTDRLEAERTHRERIRRYELSEALRSPRVLALCLVYFGNAFAGYGINIFQPQIIHRLGVTVTQTGLLNAIPYLFAAVTMVLWGRHSDKTGERTGHVAIVCLVGGAGLAACTLIANPILTMIALTVASMGLASIAPIFWSLPTALLTGTAAAGGIALINAVGNLGGFFGPYAVGLIKDASGSYTLGLLALAAGPIVSAIVVLALGHDRRLEQVPARQA